MTSPCTPIERPAGRHDLVFVSPQGWRSLLATRGDLAADPLVARWVDNGWPLIGRRAMPGEGTACALGLPLPPFAGKTAAFVPDAAEDIVSIAPPAFAESASRLAPRAWRPTLDRL